MNIHSFFSRLKHTVSSKMEMKKILLIISRGTYSFSRQDFFKKQRIT